MQTSEKYLEPGRELGVYGTYDVIVVGGGCAGITAAIAAARTGARTLIVERFPFFGGTATASLMGNINGFRNQVEPDKWEITGPGGVKGEGRTPSEAYGQILKRVKQDVH